MASELKEETLEDLNEEGATRFEATRTGNAYFYPTGVLGRFFAKFFATKAKPYVADYEKNSGLAGDTIIQTDVVKTETKGMGFSVLKSEPYFPEVEKNRRKRYKQYEDMDEYPEIGATFDIYADDCTQRDIRGRKWTIKSENLNVVEEINRLFTKLKLDRFYWDICRNAVKYGDCFIETILDVNNPTFGIQRVKVLNPNYIIRVENEYGYLTDFLQEIPDPKGDVNYSTSPSLSQDRIKFITLDKNQIVHFRLFTSDPAFYPYGKSIAALSVRIIAHLSLWKMLCWFIGWLEHQKDEFFM